MDNALTDCNVGSRKRCNIHDNLFVIYAILNACKQRKESSNDINVYDVLKCFDKMWNLECINDLYEAGFVNDKLNLLYLENITAQFAVKNFQWSDRFNEHLRFYHAGDSLVRVILYSNDG